MNSKDIEINGLIYTVYENGEVYRGNYKIKQRPSCPDGYACFTAGKKNHRKVVRTHTLVGKLFIDNPNKYTELDYIDGNRMNPSSNNLEWVTHKENIKRAYEKGKYNGHIVGIKNPKAKLNENTVINIRKDFASGIKQNVISKQYDIPWSTIHNIVTYQTWKHVI